MTTPVQRFAIAVPSFSRPGERHVVTRTVRPDGEGTETSWRCECIAFDMSGRRRTCRHVVIGRKAAAAYERCAAAGHQGVVSAGAEAHPRRFICEPCLVALIAAAARHVERNYRPKGERRPPRKPRPTFRAENTKLRTGLRAVLMELEHELEANDIEDIKQNPVLNFKRKLADKWWRVLRKAEGDPDGQ